MKTVSEILQEVKTGQLLLQCGLPMGYVEGIPTLQIRNENLCLMIPFLKYKVTGQVDRTLVYPIRYVMTVTVPEVHAVEFADLKYAPRFRRVDFNAPIGLFRHEAVQDLDRNAYKTLREELLGLYDRLAESLLTGADWAAADEARMRELLVRLTEPSQLPIYKALDPDFYQKYMSEAAE